MPSSDLRRLQQGFAPTRTRFDWLSSRDKAIVDAYVADRLCGFKCTNQFWVDFRDARARVNTPAALASFPRDLPIYVIAGSHDPVSRATRGLVALLAAFRRAGLTNVTHEFFPEARIDELLPHNWTPPRPEPSA